MLTDTHTHTYNIYAERYMLTDTHTHTHITYMQRVYFMTVLDSGNRNTYTQTLEKQIHTYKLWKKKYIHTNTHIESYPGNYNLALMQPKYTYFVHTYIHT